MALLVKLFYPPRIFFFYIRSCRGEGDENKRVVRYETQWLVPKFKSTKIPDQWLKSRALFFFFWHILRQKWPQNHHASTIVNHVCLVYPHRMICLFVCYKDQNQGHDTQGQSQVKPPQATAWARDATPHIGYRMIKYFTVYIQWIYLILQFD